jgi:hypothetical protein
MVMVLPAEVAVADAVLVGVYVPVGGTGVLVAVNVAVAVDVSVGADVKV